MGIDVSKLRPLPSTLNEGVTKVIMSYYGVVDNPEDNPVNLKLYIEPSSPAFFIEKGQRKKILNKKEKFNTVPAMYKWEVYIEIIETPTTPTACSLLLEATDSKGYKSKTKSFFIYH